MKNCALFLSAKAAISCSEATFPSILNTLGGYKARAAALHLFKLLIQVLHVHMLKAMTLRLTESDAVNNTCMIKLVSKNCVFVVEYGSK